MTPRGSTITPLALMELRAPPPFVMHRTFTIDPRTRSLRAEGERAGAAGAGFVAGVGVFADSVFDGEGIFFAGGCNTGVLEAVASASVVVALSVF